MKKDKKPYNPAAYPLFGIRLSPHPLQFIVMSHLRVQFVLHLFEETDKDPLFGDESGENLSYESLPADHPVTNYRARQVASCLRNNSPLSTPIKRISHQPK